MPTIFLTGFPGFLGIELLPRLLKRNEGLTATCLVQPKFMSLARRKADEMARADAQLANRIVLVEGDITRPDLGLGTAEELKREVREVYHLAAIYDLTVARELAMRVNLDGTVNLLNFAAACKGLTRFQYVSTCYVSGLTPGVFSERDLERGQKFNNYYEETKYLAEVEVQHRMKEGLPATIYRPSIVVGDSATGATQKYDGPYFVMQWLLRQPRYAVMPMVGNPDEHVVNVVPRDYVVDALSHLSGLSKSLGKVYQLSDPHPINVRRMVDEIARATGRRLFTLPLPYRVARNAVCHVPGVFRLLKIPAEALDYFVHPTMYTCEDTVADLEGSGIRCPAFAEYAPRLVTFMRQHPEYSSAAMA